MAGSQGFPSSASQGTRVWATSRLTVALTTSTKWVDMLSMAKGRHGIKFGINVRRVQNDY